MLARFLLQGTTTDPQLHLHHSSLQIFSPQLLYQPLMLMISFLRRSNTGKVMQVLYYLFVASNKLIERAASALLSVIVTLLIDGWFLPAILTYLYATVASF